MGRVAVRKETGKLFFDFNYLGKRCRVKLKSGVWEEVGRVAYPVD
ncbi:Arm DNA-binding domain-containing protein [Halomonas piscis]